MLLVGSSIYTGKISILKKNFLSSLYLFQEWDYHITICSDLIRTLVMPILDSIKDVEVLTLKVVPVFIRDVWVAHQIHMMRFDVLIRNAVVAVMATQTCSVGVAVSTWIAFYTIACSDAMLISFMY